MLLSAHERHVALREVVTDADVLDELFALWERRIFVGVGAR